MHLVNGVELQHSDVDVVRVTWALTCNLGVPDRPTHHSHPPAVAIVTALSWEFPHDAIASCSDIDGIPRIAVNAASELNILTVFATSHGNALLDWDFLVSIFLFAYRDHP